ncbi:MAG: hypothetical protein OHK93_001393 [Ramalina farinacea]|uniref:Uncharacterized protein n=1 Tax=Ramalina farinacea TaxID=258253 RepID=A0AA43QSS0_9LECA|nr:hypothetical protein [Ramalina farinacea]
MSASPSVASSVTLTDNASWESVSLASTIKAEPDNDCQELKVQDPNESPPAARSADPPSVRLCNHETLPFDRAYRIVNLPNFKECFSPLDALGAKPIPQHTRSSAAEPYQCTNASGFKVTCDVNYSVLPDLGTGWIGMILKQRWTQHGLHKKQTRDKSTLQAYFSKEIDFAFCPHLRASSDEVVDRAFRMVCPDAGHPDPVEEWVLRGGSPNSSGDITLSCSKCKTKLRFFGSSTHISIDVKRHLGECASSEDELWLQQCEQHNA